MNMYFNEIEAINYNSSRQKTRVMSESWFLNNMYCPCCGAEKIIKLPNNKPVADFICEMCDEVYELKSKKGNLGKKVPDGAYFTAIDRITSTTNPDLFLLRYNSSLKVTDLTLISKYYFVPDIIEKRNPLPPTARRAGWVGSNIIIKDIPVQGKIEIIQNGSWLSRDSVLESYNKAKSLQTSNMEKRGWLLDVLQCVNDINSDVFALNEVYKYSDSLYQKHPNNNNIEAKIRQQLQVLRDKKFILFLGNGNYKKLT